MDSEYLRSDDPGRDRLDKLVRHRSELREDDHRKYQNQSREKLKKNIEGKIKTTMIGALAQIEQFLGELWGQGKPRNSLSEAERRMEDVYIRLRTEILNLGNNQIRAAMSEINQYEVDWQRYRYETQSDGAVDHGGKFAVKEINPIFGLKADGTPKALRYGRNPDGSINTGPRGPEGRSE